ncbi:MAG: DNA translocase FtsK, partial [Alphaproteobacteria bacterium]
ARVEPRMSDDDDLMPDMAEEDPPVAPKPKAKRRVGKAAAKPRKSKRSADESQGSLLTPEGFTLPPLHLLAETPATNRRTELSADALEQNARLLEGVLDDFGVRGEIINVWPGPVVTLYELEPAPGIKSARVIGLADDIARSMSAISCRVAVIPGKNAIGIELPNSRRETVYLRELLASQDFETSKSKLGLCLGKTIGGAPVIADLARMPHLLVAGTTGSGKSVSINTMILSLLYRMSPDECRMIMIDPKMLELSTYDGIPHLLTPVVTDPKQAVVALKWTVREMEDRYRKMSKLGVRNLHGFNARVGEAAAKGETLTRTVQTGFDPETGEAIYEQEELTLEPMPFIVVVIDEMADLMMVAGKDIEGAVQRLAQMARAAGIHVVMATQRPSVDVITGTIKANFPTRISFQVTSKIDSRTILGEQGAEQLLGQGDMLYMAGGGRIQRVHGPFVSDEEVEDVVAHLKTQGTPDYLHAITIDDSEDGDDMGVGSDPEGAANSLYDQAVAIVLRDKKASTSYVQRRLSIGYNRAASIIERMEEEGVVGPANHAGKRDILVEDDEGISRFG